MRLGSTIAPDLQRTLGDIQSQLRAGDGIALRLQATQSGYDRLFPREVSASLSTDDVLRNAKSRWDEEYAALRRAALLQGQIADSVDGDVRLLGDAMARSKNAAGALEVAQAGNELAGLSVKQSLQLQSLLAAQQRAEAFARARDLATEDEARQRFKTFVGNGLGLQREPVAAITTELNSAPAGAGAQRRSFVRFEGPWTTSPSSTASPRPSAATSIPALACWRATSPS